MSILCFQVSENVSDILSPSSYKKKSSKIFLRTKTCFATLALLHHRDTAPQGIPAQHTSPCSYSTGSHEKPQMIFYVEF